MLEDTDGDGRYEKVTTFADGLNIPMGIYPWKGGCVAFSIPNIWHFEDTDGNGVCDKRTVLYGPFDTSRDTHGMVNSFRRGWDGWVYACHGFNNDSRVKGADGHEIHMQSGNTFRFQLDGSRIDLIRGGPTAATGFLRNAMAGSLIETMVPAVGDGLRLASDPLVGQVLSALTGVNVGQVARGFSAEIDSAIWTEMGVEEAAIRANPEQTNDAVLIAALKVL